MSAPRVDEGKVILHVGCFFAPRELLVFHPRTPSLHRFNANADAHLPVACGFRSNGGVREGGTVEQDAGAACGGPRQRAAAGRCDPQRRHGLSWKVRTGNAVWCDGVVA